MKFNTTIISTLNVLKKQSLLFCLLIVPFSSCLGPKKLNKWVAQQYGAVPVPSKKKNDGIVISSTIPTMGDQLSNTENKTSQVLPLIFYWQWDYKNTCTLYPQIEINNFTNTVLTYSNKGLKQKLNGGHIELVIEKIPTTFALDDKGHLIWLIYTFGWEFLSVKPEDKDMIVSYKLFGRDNSPLKSGRISITNSDKGVSIGKFQSMKKKTFQYLDQYNESITLMSKTIVDKIIVEL